MCMQNTLIKCFCQLMSRNVFLLNVHNYRKYFIKNQIQYILWLMAVCVCGYRSIVFQHILVLIFSVRISAQVQLFCQHLGRTARSWVMYTDITVFPCELNLGPGTSGTLVKCFVTLRQLYGKCFICMFMLQKQINCQSLCRVYEWTMALLLLSWNDTKSK